MSTTEKQANMSPLAFAERVGISRSLCYLLLQEKRIPGAFRVGQRGRRGRWLIPESSVDIFVSTLQNLEEA